MDQHEAFRAECASEIDAMGADRGLLALTQQWINAANRMKYSYHFEWLGRPIIQYPQDIVVMQELIWSVKPDLIVETGIARGGSLIFSASMLALLDICDAIERGGSFDPKAGHRKVLGVDIDIRAHNRSAIDAHPMASRIAMIQGSSIAPQIVEQVHAFAKNYSRVLVCLDSNHTHEHVLAELNAYAPLVSSGSYCVVFDTIIEHLPREALTDRPWAPGNNPKTAVEQFLKQHPEFELEQRIEQKLLITVAPGGYLKRAR